MGSVAHREYSVGSLITEKMKYRLKKYYISNEFRDLHITSIQITIFSIEYIYLFIFSIIHFISNENLPVITCLKKETIFMEQFSDIKGSTTTCYNVWKQYSMWKKPVIKDHILCDSIDMKCAE